MAKLRVAWALPLVLLAGSIRLDHRPPAPDAKDAMTTSSPSPTPDPIGPAGRARLVSERRRHREEMEQRVVVPSSRGEAHAHDAIEKEG